MQSTTAATSPAAIGSLLDRKITLATEGFTTKFCELTLKDRKKLSKENALVVAEYIIAMKREINPRLSYLRYTIQFLSELARTNSKQYKEMSDQDIYRYLDSNRKPDSQDSLHKWIGSYNIKRIILIRFFKWLFYPNIANPKTRNELSRSERRPECIMDIPHTKDKSWPKQPNTLSRRLNEVTASLREVGIIVERYVIDPHKKTKGIKIRKIS